MTNYFKKSWLMAFILPALMCGVMSCSSDDGYSAVDNQVPTIELSSDHIQTEAGRAFTISGTIKDADGIKSINLKSEGLQLDKTINLLDLYDGLQTVYNLNYTYLKKFIESKLYDCLGTHKYYEYILKMEEEKGIRETYSQKAPSEGN